MAIVRGKQKNASECMRRRFRSDVNKLKKACDELNIVILSQKECDYKDYVCILSIDEYNIFDTYKNCNKTVESYFVAPEDYEVLVEENYV